MWLLFLNSLKGLKTKKVQMLGLICLIVFTTGIYTVVNSSLDRMDSMSQEYMDSQNTENMTLLLNETKILSRENIADMFNEKLDGWKDIVLEPVTVTDEMLATYDKATLDKYREQIAAAGVPAPMIDTVLKGKIGEVLAGSNYLMGILKGTYPVNDLNTYIFYGCSATAKDAATNSDPNLPYAKFCPTSLSTAAAATTTEESGSDEDECDDSSSTSEYATTIMRLYSNFSQMTDTSKYDVDKYKYLSVVMDELAVKYDFTYVLKASKVITYDKEGDDQSYAASVMIYKDGIKVNTPYLVSGRWPNALNEITVAPQFIASNNLKVGDNWEISGTTYTIVGEAYAPDYIYPAVSLNTPLYDEHRHTVIFATEETYNNFVGSVSHYYTARFNSYHGTYDSKELDALVDEVSDDEYVTYVLSTATIHPRISTYTLEIKNNRTFTAYFMYVLLAIAVFIIIMVMKKRIDDERLQIGVLKSLGYKTTMIAAGYLVYPVVGSLVGGILGYFLGLSLQTPVVSLYKAFYNIPTNDFQLYPKYLILSVVVPLVALSVLSYLVALFMLRQRPLKLLREGSNLKVNVVTKAITKLTAPLRFKSRFRLSLASRSLGKLFVITLCAFCTGLLLVLTLIGSTMMNLMVEYTFAGASFDYQVEYTTVQDPTTIVGYSEDHTGEDLILNTDLTLYKVEHANGKEAVLSTTKSMSISGVAEDLNLIHITDSKGKDLEAKLFEDNGSGYDGIIINDTVKTLLKVDVGDVLVLTKRVNIDGNVQCANDKRYYVVGVNQTFSGLNTYVTRKSIADYLGYSEGSYNYIYTDTMKDIYDVSNEAISDVFRVEDLKKNVELAVQMANYSIYIIVFFSGAMALVIISVVSNIVVDENKKHISLMKVMGYTEKEIKGVVLNIYTPFVIIAYLLSIPAMKSILRWILSLATKDLDFSVPIVLSWQGALLGFAVIMVAYLIALQLSRRALNKVSLAEALKRE